MAREDQQLSDLVRKMWEVDEPPTCHVVRPDDIKAEEMTAASLKKVEGGYEIGLPWKKSKTELPTNYAMAANRLKSLERKLKSNPTLGAAYNDIISTYVQKGYVHQVL